MFGFNKAADELSESLQDFNKTVDGCKAIMDVVNKSNERFYESVGKPIEGVTDRAERHGIYITVGDNIMPIMKQMLDKLDEYKDKLDEEKLDNGN